MSPDYLRSLSEEELEGLEYDLKMELKELDARLEAKERASERDIRSLGILVIVGYYVLMIMLHVKGFI